MPPFIRSGLQQPPKDCRKEQLLAAGVHLIMPKRCYLKYSPKQMLLHKSSTPVQCKPLTLAHTTGFKHSLKFG